MARPLRLASAGSSSKATDETASSKSPTASRERPMKQARSQESKKSNFPRGSDRKGKGSRGHGPAKAPSAEREVGASKIKASIRQTKRLLAKDNLALDVRQEAERRLKALEEELVSKTSSERERKNAERYHKVRFFERQKLVRQCKKLNKALQAAADKSDKERKVIQEELTEKRVLLNYVLCFPTSLKYVSLFPSTGESPFNRPRPLGTGKGKEPAEVSKGAMQSHERAMSVRKKVEEAMAKGEMSRHPEQDLEQRSGEGAGGAAAPASSTSANPKKRTRLDMGDGKEKQQRKDKTVASKQGRKAAPVEEKGGQGGGGGVGGDDFFASDSE